MSLLPMLAVTGGGSAPTYVDDVFSAYLYTGNGSTQTVTNGIDLSTNGGMVWTKERSANGSARYQCLADTVQGPGKWLFANNTNNQGSDGTKCISSFNTTGYTLSDNAAGNYCVNGSTGTQSYVGWTFRKAAKFFDIQTWTGNATNRTISHSLGAVPGMILVKRLDTSADWQVYHRSLANTEYMVLNSTAAKATGATRWNSTTADASVFSLGTDTTVNASGGTYIAYLFGHDAATDGVVQCGTFTTDGSGVASINLGWEVQYVMVKRTDSTGNWMVFDVMRGDTVRNGTSNTEQILYPNLSNVESGSYGICSPTATGFEATASYTSATFIYLAIRRPNKPPTVGTQVYNAIARTGTGAAATVTGVGFPFDLLMGGGRFGQALWGHSRLQGIKQELRLSATLAEYTTGATSFDTLLQDGYSILGADPTLNASGGSDYINWFFRRAPGVFDVACDTGTGSAHTVSHNLGVVPELMIRKGRSGATDWQVYTSAIANTEKLVLNTTAAKATDTTAWNSTTPTSSVFTVGTGANVNTNAATYVTYLFATKAGISKVGSYTGNGSSQTINCGFTTGARFILIKRTDAAGDWYAWDTVRGIVAGNDPHLSLNTTATEVTTDDSIDPDTSGFVVNQVSGVDVNVTSATYIYLAIA